MSTTDDLRRTLTATLLQAGRQWRRIAERELTRLNISEACAAPLLWIGRLGGGVRQVALASHVGIEGPSLVRLLDQLAASGFVVRRDDPMDRRAKTLWLTAEGEALSAKIEDLLVSVRGEVLANIDADDLAAALRVLKAFDDASVRSPAREEAVP